MGFISGMPDSSLHQLRSSYFPSLPHLKSIPHKGRHSHVFWRLHLVSLVYMNTSASGQWHLLDLKINTKLNSVTLWRSYNHSSVMPFLPRLSCCLRLPSVFWVKNMKTAEYLALSPEAHTCSFSPNTKPCTLWPASGVLHGKWKSAFIICSFEKRQSPWVVSLDLHKVWLEN